MQVQEYLDQEYLLDQEYQKARSDDIKKICKGVQELDDITHDLKTLVYEQNDQIIYIENNIRKTEDNIKKGGDYVNQSNQEHTCCDKLKKNMIYILCILIFVLCVILIIKLYITR